MDPKRKKATIAVAMLLAMAAVGAAQKNPPAATKIPAGQLWFVEVVPRMAAMTEAQTAVARSTAIEKQLATKQNHKRVWDPDTAPKSGQFCVDRVKADDPDGSGRLLILDGRAKSAKAAIVDSQPVKSEAAAITLIKKWGG